MKVTILEGCKKGGNTDALCGEFARGAKEAGHEVERIYLFGKQVHGCIDCQCCQVNGGTCTWKDDGCEILDAALCADVLVFASPVYYYGITGQLKTIQGWVDCFGDDVRFSGAVGAWNMSGNPDVTQSPAYEMAYQEGRAL